ncbi:MAG: GGDEF domain-containing protein [Rubrivivax sp.]|nr:GGDEF domain-containing protein [Rubrivivax sp.]
MNEETVETLLTRAEQARAQGAVGEGLAAAEQAWAATGPETPALRLRAGLLLAHFRYRSGALSAVMDVGLEVAPLLRASGPRTELIDLLRMVALGGSETNRFEEALNAAQEAHRLAVEIRDTARISLCTNVLGCFFERTGDPWQAERLLLEALALARQQPERHPVFAALNNLGATRIGKFYLLRDALTLDEALEPLRQTLPYAREAVALAAAVGDPFFQVFTQGNLGEILVHLDQAEDAQQTLAEALALSEQHGLAEQTWRIGCSLGELELLLGRPQLAWDRLSAVLQAATASDQRTTHMRLHHALWRAARALDQPDLALGHLESYVHLERKRAVTQLRAQSDLFVTRVEAEHMRLEAQRHHARANELEADVRRDSLTGLGNRRELEWRWPELLERVRLDAAPLSVAMLDLDDFKLVNDRFGHAVGDQVLVALGGLFRSHTRLGDLVVRLGGEEFLLALPDTPVTRAFEICERLRDCVATHDWDALAPGLRVTLSVGLSSAPPYDAQGLSMRADAALYRAKADGRNRVVQG